MHGFELIACETCGSAERELHGRTGGERLLSELRAAREAGVGPVDPELKLSSVRCLWACSRSCAVHLRAAGRPGYVLVGFEAGPEAARAILEWAALYAQSSDGAVPYKQWPAGVKGHFLCRVPAGPDLTTADQPNPEQERP
jgi:predicted metal-binding protein